MTATAGRRLRVGLIGLGRLGRVYARDLAWRIPETALAAVCDPLDDVVSVVADELGAAGRYTRAEDLISDPNVEAVVIVSPTRTHKDLSILCAGAGKSTFCEKPAALNLADAHAMAAAVKASGTFFQMGFMRRFDPGYAGGPRSPERRPDRKGRALQVQLPRSLRLRLEYADPKSSGG